MNLLFPVIMTLVDKNEILNFWILQNVVLCDFLCFHGEAKAYSEASALCDNNAPMSKTMSQEAKAYSEALPSGLSWFPQTRKVTRNR